MKFDEFNLDTEEFSLEHLLDSKKNFDLIKQFSVPNRLDLKLPMDGTRVLRIF